MTQVKVLVVLIEAVRQGLATVLEIQVTVAATVPVAATSIK